eukprot:Sro505_g156110.2  (95) ;mRNA; r:12353-12637
MSVSSSESDDAPALMLPAEYQTPTCEVSMMGMSQELLDDCSWGEIDSPAVMYFDSSKRRSTMATSTSNSEDNDDEEASVTDSIRDKYELRLLAY